MSCLDDGEKILLPQSGDHDNEIKHNNEDNEEDNQNNQNNQLQTHDTQPLYPYNSLNISPTYSFLYGMATGKCFPYGGFVFAGGVFYTIMWLNHNKIVEIKAKELEKFIKRFLQTAGDESIMEIMYRFINNNKLAIFTFMLGMGIFGY